MEYEINVSLNGSHLFATHERSLTYEKAALSVFELFKLKFPKSEGYELTLTRYTKSGTTIAVNN